jgi:hypothetical protein
METLAAWSKLMKFSQVLSHSPVRWKELFRSLNLDILNSGDAARDAVMLGVPIPPHTHSNQPFFVSTSPSTDQGQGEPGSSLLASPSRVKIPFLV